MDQESTDESALKKGALKLVAVFAVIALLGAYFGGTGRDWGMSEPSRLALAILLIAATLWITEAVPLFVTGFVILLLSIAWLEPSMSRAGIEVSRSQFLAPFFSDIILLFLGGFVLSAALRKYRLDEQLARWIIRQSGGSLPGLLLGVMLITAFLSMWLSNTATAAMMLALVLPIVRGFPEGSRVRKAIVLAVPFAANAGGLGTPIGSPPNAIAMQYMRDIGVAPSFGEWMLAGVPLLLAVLAIAWALLVFGYGAKGRVDHIECERLNLKITPGIKIVILVSLLTVTGWMTSGSHGFSSGTVALLPLIAFFGTGLLNIRDLRSLSWDVLLVMGGGLCLGTVISVSGLAEWVVAQLNVDALGVYGVAVAFGALACIMSSVMSNTATANLLLPIVLGLTIEPVMPVLLGVAFACSLAMALPISTPPNAMAFSSGELKAIDIFKPGALLTAVGVVLVFTAGYWWWGVLGLF